MSKVTCQYFVLCLQAWADAFRSSPDLTGVVQIYEELKRKGVEFPMADLDALSPIHTPQRVRQPHHATYSTIFLPFFSSFVLWNQHITCRVLHSYVCVSVWREIFLSIFSQNKNRYFCLSSFLFFWWFLKNGFIFLNLWFNQGVPEVDPASHKYKATPQPKPASQTPQTSAPSSLPAQTHLPNMAGPITPNPEQVSLTIKHCVLHCLRRDV